MMRDIIKTDRCEMPTSRLPAASLSRHIRLPARRALLRASNHLVYLALWSIREALLRVRSHFLPALREGEGLAAADKRHLGRHHGQELDVRLGCDGRHEDDGAGDVLRSE